MNADRQDMDLNEKNKKFKVGKVLGPIANNWPAITGVIGLGTLVVGVSIAASGSTDALTPVGTSNLAMVLALSGSALVLFSIWSRHLKEREFAGAAHWYSMSKKRCIRKGGEIAVSVVAIAAIMSRLANEVQRFVNSRE
ncbi:MAG: hypothetical protein JSS50_03380 [Proteobacteria bacterium]|nr:hypothetical protein [Pseudomonadota bacterium]